MSNSNNCALLIAGLIISQSVFIPMELSAQGGTTALDEEDYVSVIREIDFTVGDAELHIDQKYWGDLGTDSDALKALMEQIKAFWQEQNRSSVIEHSSQALVAISQLSRASGQENESEAKQAVQTLKEHLRAIKDLNQRNQTKFQLLNMFYDD